MKQIKRKRKKEKRKGIACRRRISNLCTKLSDFIPCMRKIRNTHQLHPLHILLALSYVNLKFSELREKISRTEVILTTINSYSKKALTVVA